MWAKLTAYRRWGHFFQDSNDLIVLIRSIVAQVSYKALSYKKNACTSGEIFCYGESLIWRGGAALKYLDLFYFNICCSPMFLVSKMGSTTSQLQAVLYLWPQTQGGTAKCIRNA